MFPTGALSFQVSQQIKSGDDLSVSINTIKHFLRKGRENIASRRNYFIHESLMSPEVTVNAVKES